MFVRAVVQLAHSGSGNCPKKESLMEAIAFWWGVLEEEESEIVFDV